MKRRPLTTLLAAASCLASTSCHALTVSVSSGCSSRGSCRGDLTTALEKCAVSSEPCTVLLDSADPYTVHAEDGNACAIKISAGSQPMALRGQGSTGSTIMLTSLSGFLCVTGGKGVTVSGLSIDMQRQPYSYGKVQWSNSQSTRGEGLERRLPLLGPGLAAAGAGHAAVRPLHLAAGGWRRRGQLPGGRLQLDRQRGRHRGHQRGRGGSARHLPLPPLVDPPTVLL